MLVQTVTGNLSIERLPLLYQDQYLIAKCCFLFLNWSFHLDTMQQHNHRPPTKRKIQKLKDCYEKQLSSGNGEPCLQEELKGALSGLYKRGFVETKMAEIKGKQLLCLFVTDSGIKFLKDLEKKVS